MSTIKFERVERDCPRNRNLRENGEARRIIYDYNVIICGEHRATMSRNSTGVGYYIFDAEHQPITFKDTYTRHAGDLVARVHSQAEFEPTIQRLLSEERIPTLAQMAAAKADRQRQADQRAAEEHEERRIRKIQLAAVDLYEALKNFIEDRDISYTDALEHARTAIAKAEKGDQA